MELGSGSTPSSPPPPPSPITGFPVDLQGLVPEEKTVTLSASMPKNST